LQADRWRLKERADGAGASSVEHAYAELDSAAGAGTLLQQDALGDPRLLARPWDPASCVGPDLRAELWQWLDQVVIWLNHEYVWDVEATIPPRWPRHPHLVHEIADFAEEHCQDGHQAWPAQGRHTRHHGSQARRDRSAAYRADCGGLVDPSLRGPVDRGREG